MQPLHLRQAPVLAAAASFAVGIALTRIGPQWTRPSWLLAAMVAASLALSAISLRHSLRLAMLPVCTLWLVAGIWSAQIEPYPAPSPLLHDADGLSRRVEGRVLRVRTAQPLETQPGSSSLDTDTEPDAWDDPEPDRLIVDLAVDRVEELTPDLSTMVSTSGNIRLTLRGTALPAALHCGQQIAIPARLRLPERFRDPGVFQYADYLLNDDPSQIVALGTAPAARLQTVSNDTQPRTLALRCRLFSAQTWAGSRLEAYGRSTVNRSMPSALRLQPQDVATLDAMLFGDRTRLNRNLRLGFERTGSFHLFVVSGLHVAVLAGMVLWALRPLRRLGLGPLASTSITLLLTSAYALLTGFGVPVRRALLMTAIFLIARLLFRERAVLNALGAAALAVLVASPRALSSSSFQMTFLAVVAIGGLAVPFAERRLVACSFAAKDLRAAWRDRLLPPRLAQQRVMLRLWGEAVAALLPRGRLARQAQVLPAALLRLTIWAAELTLVSVVVELVMVLPMALVFHRVTLFALPANLATVPLVALMLPLALAMFCLAFVSPWLAAVPAATVAVLLHAVAHGIAWMAHLHAANLRVPGPPLPRALAALAILALACCFARRPRSAAWIAAPLLLALAAAIAVWPAKTSLEPARLEVTAIDVGQGDSILVVSPDGPTMLIDAGGPTGAAARAENGAGSAFDLGEEVVSPYLWSRQLRRLDVVVLTHAHSDHMGGMPAILRNFRPRELWVGIDPNSSAYRALLAEAAADGVTVRHLHAPDRMHWGGTDISVLAPAPNYRNPGDPGNNDSLVLHLQYGQASVLLEGDAEAPSETRMLATGAIAPVTLLKVAHHGSFTSTTPEFLALAAPQDAVISVGSSNTFGHPRAEIIARLAAIHTRVYRTDRMGLVTFLLSPDGRIAMQPAASDP
jgi:competence protein ComEC